jgi:oxalate decarboxylase
VYENSGGSIRIADSTNFPASKAVAAALVTVKPGSMRELHWPTGSATCRPNSFPRT